MTRIIPNVFYTPCGFRRTWALIDNSGYPLGEYNSLEECLKQKRKNEKRVIKHDLFS